MDVAGRSERADGADGIDAGADRQERLLALRLAYDRLAPGGVLLLKEIDPEHRAKALWNRAQEKMADLLGMTLGDAFSYETRDQLRERLTRIGFESFSARAIGAGYPHAHILYTARRPVGRDSGGEKSLPSTRA